MKDVGKVSVQIIQPPITIPFGEKPCAMCPGYLVDKILVVTSFHISVDGHIKPAENPQPRKLSPPKFFQVNNPR